MHPFPLFLSLSSFSFFLQTRSTTYILPYIYLYFIYLCVVRYTDEYGVFLFHSFVFAWFLRFNALCGFYSLSERSLSLSSFLNRPTPPPFHGTESVATPFLNFFIFSFSKFFVEKIRYDLFTFCICLCRYLIFTF